MGIFNFFKKKLSRLKVYISKNGNGEVNGECFLNNEHWPAGFTLLENYTNS